MNGAAIQGTTLQVTALDHLPDQPVLPSFELAEFNMTYHRTMATEAHPFGQVNVQITANLLLSRAGAQTGQAEARRLASPANDSIVAALLAARGAPGQPALNGACEDFYVQSARGPRLIDGGTETVKFYAIEFAIHLIGL